MSSDILLKITEKQINNRALFYTPVEVDEGEYNGYLYLFDNLFAIVVNRGDNRYRNYTWSYKSIKDFTTQNLNRSTEQVIGLKPKLLITLHPNLELKEQDEQVLNLSFTGETLEREKFIFRLKILAQLYTRRKMSINSNNDKNGDSSSGRFSISQDTDDLLSVSNLSKLAGPQQVSSKLCRTSMKLKSVSPTSQPDEFFSVENLSKLAGPSKSGIPVTSNGLITANEESKVSSNNKISIPIELDAGGNKYTLNAEATITIKMNLDLVSLLAAQKITDEKLRLEKIRELVQLDATFCELNFV